MKNNETKIKKISPNSSLENKFIWNLIFIKFNFYYKFNLNILGYFRGIRSF